jgi:hypothetical protein
MSDIYPSSLEEKRGWLFVHELKAMLNELKDDDWIIPNHVGNLSVNREKEGMIAAINFSWAKMEWFTCELESLRPSSPPPLSIHVTDRASGKGKMGGS